MRLYHFTFVLAAAIGLRAQLTIPGANGSDGALTPATNLRVDLTAAADGAWDAPSRTLGQGVYDSNKWAVVFHYTNVHISNNVTVSFRNHRSRAPVVWLVSGDVIIDGVINLNAAAPTETQSVPGPGGFRGSFANSLGVRGRDGFGPGGGMTSFGSANYASVGVNNANPTLYGNSRILPLIGGSGGGSAFATGFQGNAGGGAILIAAQGRIVVNGEIQANSNTVFGDYGSGSGGAVRLICNRLEGTGDITARSLHAYGGIGRIRLEAASYFGSLETVPLTTVARPDSPPLIWPPDDSPTVRVLTVAGATVSRDPVSNLNTGPADVTFQSADPVDIEIETANLATNSIVTARLVPTIGASLRTNATFISGDQIKALWRIKTTLPNGRAAIQVHALEP